MKDMRIKQIRFERLRKLIDERYNGNAGRCADFMGMKRPQINRWLTKNDDVRQGIAEDSARMIEMRHSLPRGWLDQADDIDLLKSVTDQISSVIIKGVEIIPSPDGLSYSVQDANDPCPASLLSAWVAGKQLNPEYLYAIRMPDESMQPSLYQDDIIVIDTTNKMQVDGLVFAINYEGRLLIRRMKRDAGEWLLSADVYDLRRYPDKRMPAASSIIGQVIYKQSDKI